MLLDRIFLSNRNLIHAFIACIYLNYFFNILRTFLSKRTILQFESPKVMADFVISAETLLDPCLDQKLDSLTHFAKECMQMGIDLLNLEFRISEDDLSIIYKEKIKRASLILTHFNEVCCIPLSVCTRQPAIAKVALENGARMICDLSGFEQKKMRELVAEYEADVCIMHTPCRLSEGLIPFLLMWFEKKITLLLHDGVQSSKILIHPRIHLGWDKEQLMDLSKAITRLKELNYRLLIDSFCSLFSSARKNDEDCLPATLLSNTIALLSGADIIRVLSKKEHISLSKILHQLEDSK